ncbi:O-antigen ligase family protein [Empedobacter falsenii]|uniref:O-antigen ligase family protein n=1 Tax=Empedobacter falsenii TaxID=343874 RepID=UPI003A8115B4
MGLTYRDISILLLIISIINDTFLSITFGRPVLLIIYLFFIICNYKIIFLYKNLRVSYLIMSLFFFVILSLIFNLSRYNEINFFNAVNLIFINYCIFKCFTYLSINKSLQYLILSLLISISLQFFYNEPLTEYTFRVSGGTGDPNEFSTQVLYSLAIFPLIQFNKLKGVWNKIIYYLYYIIAVLSILKAGSTTAGLILTIITLFNIYKLIKHNIKYTIIFSILIFILIFFVSNYLNEIDIVRDYLDRASSNDGGMNSRLGIWKVAESIITDNIFFGVGPTNFPIYSEIYSHYTLAEGSRAAHNIFILLFAESGIISILLLLFIIVNFFINTFKEKLNERYLFSIMIVFLMGLSLTMFYEKYFWFFIGIMVNAINVKKMENRTKVKL